ncbi:TonB-dependent receptor [Pontibacter harenae]|uniref:TonB-dependent receptor n=1 Tax=Pontibacter harenae TaxID=2894083 RepID=UPI001E4502DB|nr:TonB-dependent receptor [Pontibacter harenae]MCC9166934.1 TonB-dependent receptor [Pontibacter harenae]
MQKKFTLLFILFICLIIIPTLAQNTATISGRVHAANDNQSLIGATVSVPALGIGTVTDVDGHYTLQLPFGSHTLQATYVGYEPYTTYIEVTGGDALVYNLMLQVGSSQLQEVVIEANTLEQKLNDTRMGVERLSTKEAKLLPALFGEVDLVKTLQLKPGVQSGGEGASGLYVRGGGPDQNLVMVDDAVVYNPSHLLGFFSVFNPDAVRSVELYKGGFPAQYGGRLSSVLEVDMNEGNNESLAASGGLGLISSRLTFDGPIQEGKASFLISARRTYFDVITKQINKLNEGKEDYNQIPDYRFYDLNTKLNYKLGEKDELFLTGYFGRDSFGFDQSGFSFGLDWGNTIGSLQWKHKFDNKLFFSTSLTSTSYKHSISNSVGDLSYSLTSKIQDITLKTDFDLLLDGGHSIQFGALATRHAFTIGQFNFDVGDKSIEDMSYSTGKNYEAAEFGAYVSDNFEVNPLLSLSYGLRFSGFSSRGKTYTALEPRAAAKYSLSESLSLKASYASMMQYIHLVSSSGASLPTDIWYPSTPYVKPQRSQQVALGVSKLLWNGSFLLTNEAYYKWMNRQIDFRDGANLFVNNNLENDFLFGKGESYGNEIYLEKIKGRTTGWLGYTLSWAYRQFDEINNGRRFPTRYDRRHDISLVVLHQISKRISLTGAFVYGTGNAYSLPVARIIVQDVEGREAAVVPVYNDRNSFRLPAYHRLDLGIVLKLKPKHGEADLTFNVYNAYNRRNAYFVYFERVTDEHDRTETFEAKQVSLFPIIPSVTYNFKFR